ncbi:hypothetical protein PG997_001157 [Apiospora hydei]|uniref:Uncharacterized protein n=1 Tax=Apiospora hydei TaxID=1337664 RepID=A0ABR1XD26_9PEZI
MSEDPGDFGALHGGKALWSTAAPEASDAAKYGKKERSEGSSSAAMGVCSDRNPISVRRLNVPTLPHTTPDFVANHPSDISISANGLQGPVNVLNLHANAQEALAAADTEL